MSHRLRRWLVVVLTLAACAVLVLLPGLVGPVRLNDSFWIDWVWLDQFARELGSGALYPRWLPLSHHGLGSPVFYYYPPLSFYLGSVFVFAGLQTYPAILAAFLSASLLSGIGMYLWLDGQSRWPLAGAVLFVIAPYHAADFYMRGALAEYAAIAAVPFVMWGLRLVREGKRGGIATIAISYAALVCSHLPLALLASVFLIGPYALWQSYHSRHAMVGAAAGLAIGLALAAIYLVPALTLSGFRDAAALWNQSGFRPGEWSLWNAQFRSSGGLLAIMGVGAALAIPAVLTFRERSRWPIYALVCVALGIGLLPALWTLPGLSSVQFPFRILPLAEFAVATALARADWTLGKVIGTSLPLMIVTLFISLSPVPPTPVTLAQLAKLYPDVPENLPPGSRPYSWPSLWALDVADAHPRSEFSNGVTTEPVFYFPAWQVRCGSAPIPTFAAPETQLLSYRGRDCTRALVLTGAEKTGALVSLVGLLALIAAGAIALRRRSSS